MLNLLDTVFPCSVAMYENSVAPVKKCSQLKGAPIVHKSGDMTKSVLCLKMIQLCITKY